MSYAIRNDKQGWRACAGRDDVSADEYYSEAEPEVTPHATVPESVPVLNALLAIDAAGLAVSYQAWADSPDRTFAERAFITKAQSWERQSPVTLAAIKALGISSKQADELFTSAAGII